MRTLVIGDTHGQAAHLRQIVRFAKVKPGNRLIMLGDYGDSAEDDSVFRSLQQIEAGGIEVIPLLGNHEFMNMAPIIGQGSGDAMHPEYRHWLTNRCRRYFEDDKRIYVHANLDAGVPLAEQTDLYLFWKFFTFAPYHISNKIMVCGHSPQKGGRPVKYESAICVDTGAKYPNGWLTCLDVDSGFYWQIQSGSGEHRTGFFE
jgi:serine/threonine protein phosphatase 1